MNTDCDTWGAVLANQTYICPVFYTARKVLVTLVSEFRLGSVSDLLTGWLPFTGKELLTATRKHMAGAPKRWAE